MLSLEDAKELAGQLLNHPDRTHDLHLIWHGGEPTLYPPEMAAEIMDCFSRSAAARSVNMTFGMQTNGLHFPAAWRRLAKDYNIGVGVSIDGPASIHNQERKTIAGIGSYDQVEQTIALLRENGAAPVKAAPRSS